MTDFVIRYASGILASTTAVTADNAIITADSADSMTLGRYNVRHSDRAWQYDLEAVPEEYARHGIRVWGDRGENPQGLTVQVHVWAATLRQAYEDAYAIVHACETAMGVTTHYGVRPVDGLLAYSVRPVGTDVTMELTFAPRGPS